MFSRTQIKDVVIAEGQIDNLSPANLPTPDHIIRLCPWDLDSNDPHGMATQINEEFEEFNQDAAFLMIQATPQEVDVLLNNLADDLKTTLPGILVTDSGGLVSVWQHNDKAVIGFFDNGGSDIVQSIADSSTAFDDVTVLDGWGHTHFSQDNTDEGYHVYRTFFENLPKDRELHSFSNKMASKKPTLKR